MEQTPKLQTVSYWICTIPLALFFLYSGIGGFMHNPTVVTGMFHLGYPPNFVIILCIWKLLGAGAVLIPRFALLKEWAYAGMFFDMSGADLTHHGMRRSKFHSYTVGAGPGGHRVLGASPRESQAEVDLNSHGSLDLRGL